MSAKIYNLWKHSSMIRISHCRSTPSLPSIFKHQQTSVRVIATNTMGGSAVGKSPFSPKPYFPLTESSSWGVRLTRRLSHTYRTKEVHTQRTRQLHTHTHTHTQEQQF